MKKLLTILLLTATLCFAEQRIVVVTAVHGGLSATNKGVDEVNILLSQGWRVISVTPGSANASSERVSQWVVLVEKN